MIEQLSFTVRFPPTDHYPLGRAFDRSLDFSKGMTAITGPNEVGKTLVLEMIEFLLFGTSALRGAAADYKHLKATGRVHIRGIQYGIERTARNASLSQLTWSGTETNRGITDEIIAVGTKPVNQRILKTLGYGLDVFRVANVANQGDAERLSKMKPTERKAMVDKLIGADQIEGIASWCGEQALGVAREIAGLEQGLGAEPAEPVKPEGYRPADALRAEIADLRSCRETIVRGEAFLANEPVVPQVGPAPTEIPLATLEKADQILGLRTYDFDLAAAEAAVEARGAWEARKRFEDRYFPRPTLTEAEVTVERHAKNIAADIKRLLRTPEILCPCGKPFTTADAELARLRAELAGLDRPAGPFDLDQEDRAVLRWTAAVTAEWENLKNIPEAPQPAHDPRDAKGAVCLSEVAKAISDMGLTGRSRADVQRLAADVRAWQAEMVAAEVARQRREAWEKTAEATRKAVDLARRAAPEGRLEVWEALLVACHTYEAAKATYDTSFANWTAGRARLDQLRLEERSWRNGKAAMNDVRQETKTYLAPALSRVASYMLAQMTGGQRGRIVVDEDFEIEVDGQALNTLSGSGKVCANLAVRLGLGRILTNGVFPVFCGDEMDASMDADRASHLHDALCALEGKLSQILIITHKQPATPRVIKLEN